MAILGRCANFRVCRRRQERGFKGLCKICYLRIGRIPGYAQSDCPVCLQEGIECAALPVCKHPVCLTCLHEYLSGAYVPFKTSCPRCTLPLRETDLAVEQPAEEEEQQQQVLEADHDEFMRAVDVLQGNFQEIKNTIILLLFILFVSIHIAAALWGLQNAFKSHAARRLQTFTRESACMACTNSDNDIMECIASCYSG